MTALDDGVRTISATVLSFDTAFLHLADIEGLLRALTEEVALPADATVCTHVVQLPHPRYAITVALATTPSVELGAALRRRLGAADCEPARAAAAAGEGGRAVVFAGQPELRGTLPVMDVIERSAIERLEVLGGLPLGAEVQLDTRDFLRPLYRNGALVLPVMPAGPGKVAPFEVPNPTPCCGGY